MFDLVQKIILPRRSKRVVVTDVRGDASDLTTYTFTGCYIGDLGSVATVTGFNWTNECMAQSVGKRVIAVCIHAEDAATVFDVSSVTIGGVAGSEKIDRAGATVLISSAIYTWSSESLAGVGSVADIVVTFSEAVTACAIGVLNIDNCMSEGSLTSVGGQATGSINLSTGPSATNQFLSPCQIIAATCGTGGGTERIRFDNGQANSRTSSFPAPTLLYEGSVADIDYAAAYTSGSFASGAANSTDHYGISASWSGAGNGDAVTMVLA